MVAQFDGFEINPVHNGDAWKICDLCVANADRFKRYFPKTLEQNINPTLSQIFVDNKVKAFENKTVFLFTLKHSETRKLVGLIYIKELDWDEKQGEFAYCIDYNFEGKSLISKSIKALSKYAFQNLGLEILQVISHKTNTASIKVAEKNNFKWIKTLKESYTPPGEKALDMELFELYKSL
ncbi:ribosomal-protein-alanine N-acetyltransferase [Winogradskyella wandonensis]|uniref:Ribosomal-protein-alanine N-acetyltransferase n=1 Tax=Winogradskyella wandonensis TaxID=1442586 RepID=A0A4R1KT20_9FLAO|nr:GNAT family protein [Winogradskyella wandonensis]TCK67730.1 ribosomal-protein-alanine N-acetyltransferase [Winogradskyella wandonensis]